ncbi:MAG TPA: bifunctional hydroxymethylpyrimidine kinase/phosphomethylpyrimidine kinase [Candidatus Dormibacteraeota bacterium]|nr:bifunctional hydroxymethylpyrimidine kinase/phosphomethylpyrimidine kinase [Candidatus Dormibacteraeota bacterium]
MSAVLSIGTIHPWNIAGVGLDIALGARLGVEVLSIVTAVSAQDGRGVRALHPIPLDIVREEISSVPWERIAAIRIGALPSGAHVALAAELLERDPDLLAVVDPVLAASTGGALGDASVLPSMRARMLERANVVLTPNLSEAAALLGCEPIDRETMEQGARSLLIRGMRAVLLKGGHLSGEPCDLLAERAPNGERIELFSAPRIAGEARGTGCTLAFGIAAALAHGSTLRESVLAGRALVREAIAHARGMLTPATTKDRNIE